MRKLFIAWIVLKSLATSYGDVIPEVQSSEGYDSVSVEGFVLSNGRNVRLKLDTDSREVVDQVTSFLRGLDCSPVLSEGPLATSDVAGVVLKSKDSSVRLNILAGKYVSIPERRGFYEIKNVSESAGSLLLRKLMTEYPDLIKEVPRRTPPP